MRLRDAADRRKVHVRLTSAGVRVRDASSVLDPARVEALVTRLSAADRARAIAGLTLLADAAQAQMHAAAAARPHPGSAEGRGTMIRWATGCVHRPDMGQSSARIR